jgi:translation initiation factor 5B
VARDGVLPLSSWIGQVDKDKQPKNAVTVMYIFGACLLCTILPSQVAFTSLISAGGIPTTAAYGLIALLRLTMTPDDFKSSKFRLGPFAKYFYVAAVFFNAIVFAVEVSPFFFPVTAETFNFVSEFIHDFLPSRTQIADSCRDSHGRLESFWVRSPSSRS